MAVGVEDSLYVFGGNTGPGFGRPSDRAFVLREGAWEEIDAMPQSRSAGGAAAVGGSIFIVGGVGSDGPAETTMVYDTVAGSWSEAPGLLTPREHLGVASDGARVYAVGGRVGSPAGNLSVAEAFDPVTGSWTSLPDQPSPRGGIAAAVTASGILASVGGENQVDAFATAEAFDTRLGTWSVLPDMPTPRHGLGVVAIGDALYVVAGGPRAGLFTSGANEFIDLSAFRG